MRNQPIFSGLLLDDHSSEKLRLAVVAVHHEGSRRISALAGLHNLTQTQTEILAVVQGYGPLTLKDLGELVICDSGSPSRATDDLVRRGYLSRNRSGVDRRMLEVTITEGGQALLASVAGSLRVIHEGVRAKLSETQLTLVSSTLALTIEGTQEHLGLVRRFRQLDALA